MLCFVARVIFVLILCSSGLLNVVGTASKNVKKEGLYSSEDDVIILNADNMKDRVYGKSMVWLIEFYNSWCGHCINFAPTYKSFAKDLLGWRRVVSVGAVDCANEKNVHICREQSIDGYPSMKLFPPYHSGKVDSSIKTITTQQPVEMKDAVLDFITDPDFKIPPTWPRLRPIKNIADILEEATEEHKFVVLVFEDEQSIVGRQVILDLVDYPSILVRTMLKKDVQKFGIIKYPSLYIINKDSSFKHLASGTGMVDSDRHRFVDTLLSLIGMFDHNGKRINILPKKGDSQDGVVHFQQEEEQGGKSETGKSLKTAVHMQDLESALHYSLRQEVAICKTIEDEKLDALRNFVTVLAKYFPGRKEVTDFLWKLVRKLGELDSVLTGESWMELVDASTSQDAFLPERVKWTGCQGSHPRYRGYPCSMWTLFHVLTVAAYDSTTTVNAQEVPLAIRGYMKHFFGCQECSENFLKMAKNLENEIHRPLDAVVWLWSAHNRANKRLHGDISEDPEHIKIQFPSVTDCPQCHLEGKLRGAIDANQSPRWNDTAVRLFLLNYYSKDSIIQDVTNVETPASAEVAREGKSEKEMDWWEKKQEEVDLKKIRGFREQKRKQQLERSHRLTGDRSALNSDLSQIKGVGGQKLVREGDIEKETRYRQGWRWTFSDLDIGVCMAFYVCCAAIILFLYYHFLVQRRFRVPCANYLPV